MIGKVDNINAKAKENQYFRQVLETSDHTQVVIMSIPPQGEIGSEVHPDNDQILYLVDGEGRVVLDGSEEPFRKGDLVLVKAGVEHNFITVGTEPMKIITTYSPPHHPEGTIHKTKEEAEASEH
ncbi:MAG: cupin domain-containing protein [Actinobacteria bacterium]|nr:cupin domain-containing protein [Actinomycetota bacterium]